jgi:hypothetical protein
MRVNSFDRYNTQGDFEPKSGVVEEFSRDTAHPEPVRGLYTELGSALAVLYRDGDELWLRLGSEKFALDGRFKITWRHVSDGEWDHEWNLTKRAVSEVFISAAESRSITMRYDAGVSYGPPLSMIPTQSDEEDWDFGLFVANVACDPDRRSSIFTGDSYEA